MHLAVELSVGGGDTAVVTVTGELDVGTVALLEAVIGPLPGKGVRRLVVAATRLGFCDLSGLRAMYRVHTAMAAAGGGLAIAEATPALRRLLGLFDLIATSPPIRVYGSVGQALREEIGQAEDLRTGPAGSGTAPQGGRSPCQTG